LKTACVAASTPFKGESELVDSYLVECWLHFLDNPMYERDSTKIAFILSYMKKGLAATWANNVMQAMRNPKDPDTPLYWSYEVFEKNLIDAIKGGAQVEIMQAKISCTRERGGPRSILHSWTHTTTLRVTTKPRLSDSSSNGS
jgi:hypothetical protein